MRIVKCLDYPGESLGVVGVQKEGTLLNGGSEVVEKPLALPPGGS
jgi:hypothetical protein